MARVTSALCDGASWAGPVDLPLAGEIDVQAACGLMHVNGRRFGAPRRLDLNYTCLLATELGETGAVAVELGRARGIAVRESNTSAAQAALLAVSQYLASATAGPEIIHRPGGAPLVSVEGIGYEIEAVDAAVWRRFWDAMGAGPPAIAAGWPVFHRREHTATCPLPAELGLVAARTPIDRAEQCARGTGMALVRVAHPPLDDLAPYTAHPLGIPGGDLAPVDGTLPLSGLRVVECCRRDHGGMTGHLLGFLGATVVRVEPPVGEPPAGGVPMVGDVPAREHALNRGKRAVVADVSTPSGRAVVGDLVSTADVFTHDWPAGRAEAWSLDADALTAVRPGLVHAHATDWGAALGPWPPPGSDPIVQAHAGLPPTLMTVVTVYAGVILARAITTALVHRAEHRTGHRLESSLLSAATTLNARRGACTTPLSVPVCTDLTSLATDPRFAKALTHDGCVVPTSPWSFHP
ncbi:CoA transferase [Actinokineospora globicatena]|uniref:CoA-transferase family III n=1 Tax=Actinokineospora globicatena TaxID=103729 RepID=A0A9W6VAI3_9PSEU|nr:CoA transferase [Actinokineospora globicatena]GLW94337.1 hypothetical protein Aglo03_51530 [Actinokineospora globicatena]